MVMPLGKFFTLSPVGEQGCVVEVGDSSPQHGAPVVTCRPSGLLDSPPECQLWWVDAVTCSIRTKATNLCITADADGRIVVQSHQPMNNRQRWWLDGVVIRSRDRERVIGLDEEETQPGGQLYAQDKDEMFREEWCCQHTCAHYMHVRHCETLKVLDVARMDTKAGASVIIYDLNHESCDNQLWYEDQTGAIRSKLNDFLLTASTDDITMHPYNAKQRNQQWVVNNNAIVDVTNPASVLDIMVPRFKFLQNIKGSFQVIPTEYSGSADQRWQPLYVDNNETAFGTPRGPFIEIWHEASGLVLTALSLEKLGIPSSRTDVILKPKDGDSPKEQQWLIDAEQRKISSAVDGKCFDLSGEEVVLQPKQLNNHTQTWQFVAMTIKNGDDPGLYLGMPSCILGPDSPALVRLVARQAAPQWSPQLWKAVKAPADFFFIKTKAGEHVLDVKGEVKDSGGDVIIYGRKTPPADNQLWYEDEMGLIRSKLNGYVCESVDSCIKMRPYRPGAPDQQWVIFADVIKNKMKPDLCFDICHFRIKNGTKVISYKFGNKTNQKWLFEYVKPN